MQVNWAMGKYPVSAVTLAIPIFKGEQNHLFNGVQSVAS